LQRGGRRTRRSNCFDFGVNEGFDFLSLQVRVKGEGNLPNGCVGGTEVSPWGGVCVAGAKQKQGKGASCSVEGRWV